MIRAAYLFVLLFSLNVSASYLKLDEKVTISGISSGGYMASQIHLAHSKIFSGVGIFAAGPYYCARGELLSALGKCMDSILGDVDTNELVTLAKGFSAIGSIDSLLHVEGDNVFIFTGRNDRTVYPRIAKENKGFYQSLGVENIKLLDGSSAGHAYPTLNYGNDCSEPSKSPYISDCNRDYSGIMLNHLLGKLKHRKRSNSQSFYLIKQKRAPSLDRYAVAYVPGSCRDSKLCRLHVSMHGCQQGRSKIGDAFYMNVGLNEWAENNNLIILYPQANNKASGNPKGCWDWWGYTGSNYAVKSSKQIQSVIKMVQEFLNGKVILKPYISNDKNI